MARISLVSKMEDKGWNQNKRTRTIIQSGVKLTIDDGEKMYGDKSQLPQGERSAGPLS
ncbi:hypothetical protein RUM44_010515 [Polyplax serrata]|uniref:Uncharacterized protein n=1 Tax=Polyplax serrata TaxID=468196 RepID=A0ABR1AVS9_POLSC